ncbi:MAG: nucleoside deaminase [Gammaproteobacteria bacterium]|nr:nucleoside deaminase [Gammaproteobacteria bacterium]
MTATDAAHMGLALEQARQALLAGEAPVGACLVHGAAVTAGRNEVIASLDPTAHAEMQVIREAARANRGLRLDGARLFVTVEPCAMCRGACFYTGIAEIVYAASLEDMRAITGHESHSLDTAAETFRMTGGMMRAESLDLLQAWAARQSA